MVVPAFFRKIGILWELPFFISSTTKLIVELLKSPYEFGSIFS
ncbi:hypothetical protein LEP1GSC059_2134 [Leptospira noguchii serovar Panama str. CZ214]|uniref:Uncharacterized protein n=1 Tax=Leptospira noguchii serovar Panama str. CZ214 TaxID=1001595 RepID=T0FAB6_9LEPT|nr:hypothetical protein LEP1GSC059_2134 [Leptospira noguchii serovar Panama str. CZ214]